MYILIIGSILLGAILERFFKVLVLIPACAVTLAMVVASSAYFEHSLLRALLEVVVLLTSLQIGSSDRLRLRPVFIFYSQRLATQRKTILASVNDNSGDGTGNGARAALARGDSSYAAYR
jgi:hypothetical protein